MIDLHLIRNQVTEVISHSQNLSAEYLNEIPKIIDKWFEAKREFIECMGGECIYELPGKISFSLSEEEREKRFTDFQEKVHLGEWDYYSLWCFLEKNKEGFFENRVVKDELVEVGSLKPHRIQKGEKLLKNFKYFVDNEEDLAQIQTLASMIIQEDKIDGRLCISVHPLDFLSLSENTSNWRSCHALDGAYRNGNISYILDDSTVVVYLKADVDTVPPHFPFKWNNKKWRTLLFFSNDWSMLFAGRPYPFASKSGLDIVLKDLLPKAGIKGNSSLGWLPWQKNQIMSINTSTDEYETSIDLNLETCYYPVGNSLIKANKLIKDAEKATHYNDLLYSSYYTPYYTYSKGIKSVIWSNGTGDSEANSTRFKIGSETPCLICGKTLLSENGSGGMDSFICIDCEEQYGSRDDDVFAFCDCCGRHFHCSRGVICFNINGITNICNDCYAESYQRCYRCYSSIPKDKAIIGENGYPYCKTCDKIEKHRKEEGDDSESYLSNLMSVNFSDFLPF